MCGIVAMLSGGPPLERDALAAATEALAHRGPDGAGLWISEDRRAGLGHRRLAVVSPHDGAQPLASEDGRVRAVVNGEFYGYAEIRDRLRRAGHRFATASDSEILVHLYEEVGVDCLEELRGEFAFALWDGRCRRLFAARDRFGVKPLVWTQRGRQILLASEAKALFAAGVAPAWDLASILHAAHHQYPPPDRTIFRDVHQLRPGHRLVATAHHTTVEPYWDLDLPPERERERTVDEEVAIARVGAALEESVSDRLEADAPVGCYLSGGLDSSAVLALAARRSDRAPVCLGVSFAGAPDFDERARAEQVARHVGATYHAVTVTRREVLEHLGDALYFAEGLCINGHLPAKYLLSRAAREAGVRVVLTGEGSDELFAGYPHLRLDLWRSRGELDADRRNHLARAHRASAGVMLADGASAHSTHTVRRRLGAVPAFLEAKASLGARITALLRPDLREAVAAGDLFGEMLDSFDLDGQLEGRHPVDRSAYLWTKLALSGYILRTLGDGTEMAHGVEGRTPFLDDRVYAAARDLPLDLLIRDGVEKYALRRAVGPLLPTEIARRTKHPFLAPPGGDRVDAHEGSDAPLRELLHDSEIPFLDRARLDELLGELDSMEARRRHHIEPALMVVASVALLGERFDMDADAPGARRERR